MIEHSAELNELFDALAKAQAQVEAASKDKMNPAFRSKYADLASVWDACRVPLTSNGLAVPQFPRRTENGVAVTSVLTHSSGQWMSETLEIPLAANATAQQVGSAVTYGRRYMLAAIAGVAPEDDDGQKASEAAPKGPQSKPKPEAKKNAAPKDGQRSQTNSEVRNAYAKYVIAAQKLGATLRSLPDFIAAATSRTVEQVEANEAKWNSLPDAAWMKVGTLIGEALAQAGEAKHQSELKREREPGDDWDEDPTGTAEQDRGAA